LLIYDWSIKKIHDGRQFEPKKRKMAGLLKKEGGNGISCGIE
jgi:hypothetical protein